MLHVTCYLLHVTCYMLHVTCYMLHHMLSKDDANTALRSQLLCAQIATEWVSPMVPSATTRKLSCVRSVFLVICYESIPLHSSITIY
jgi:hypothetical protein